MGRWTESLGQGYKRQGNPLRITFIPGAIRLKRIERRKILSFAKLHSGSGSISYLNLLKFTGSFLEFYTVETRSLFDAFFRGYIAEMEG